MYAVVIAASKINIANIKSAIADPELSCPGSNTMPPARSGLITKNQARREPAIAYIPINTPDNPLKERNLEDSSIIFLIAFKSSL